MLSWQSDPQASVKVAGLSVADEYPAVEYGAKFDGVTDDTAAILEAAAAANSAGGGTVTFPDGTAVIGTGGQTLTHTYSNVGFRGKGMGRSVLLVAPNTILPAGGIVYVADYWNQVNCDWSDFTVDCNGANGVDGNACNQLLLPASNSDIERIEVVGRTGAYQSCGSINIRGWKQNVVGCWSHDDVWTQTTWSPSATINPGAQTITPGSITGFTANQNVVIDPSVSAFFGAATSAGVRTITPIVEYNNQFTNGGITPGMLGIVPGMTLAIGGSNAENVMVTSTTNSTFTATFSNTHSKYDPITYVGKTELVANIGVSGSTFTCTTQLTHLAGTYALLTQPPVFDSITCSGGNNPAGNTPYDQKVLFNRCERLSLNGIGINTCNNALVQGNTIIQQNSGQTVTNSYNVITKDNYYDLTWAGICPSASGQFSPYFLLNSTKQGTGITYTGATISNNVFRGGCFGVFFGLVTANNNIQAQSVISDNVIDGQTLSGIYLISFQNVGINNNIVHNPNAVGAATMPAMAGASSGANVGGINLSGISTNPAGPASIVGNDISDTRGTPLMVSALVLNGSFLTGITHNANVYKGMTSVAVQYPNNGAPVGQNNIGWNPRGAISTATLQICSPATTTTGVFAVGTTYTNVSGVDIELMVTAVGTVTSVTINGDVVWSAALVAGQRFKWPATAKGVATGGTIVFAGTGNPTCTVNGA